MKTTAFLIFCAGVLITLDSGVLTLARSEREGNWKAKGVKEVLPPSPRPSFPLLSLPSFSSFSLPALNFPYLQAFSQPNRISSLERVRTTKTEYVEVTRRQTVHPVCYTAYETKAPCLPYAQSDFHDDDCDNLELEAVHQTYDGFNSNEIKKLIRSSPTLHITPTKVFNLLEEQNSRENMRSGKYLEFKLGRNSPEDTSYRIEGSEFFPILNRAPAQRQTTEYQTKTIFITKLEKYTDRRVTATLVAVNCLPVDRSIPMCQNYPSPIKESPDRRSDGDVQFQTNSYNSTLTSSVNSDYDLSKVKPTTGVGVLKHTAISTEGTLEIEN